MFNLLHSSKHGTRDKHVRFSLLVETSSEGQELSSLKALQSPTRFNVKSPTKGKVPTPKTKEDDLINSLKSRSFLYPDERDLKFSLTKKRTSSGEQELRSPKALQSPTRFNSPTPKFPQIKEDVVSNGFMSRLNLHRDDKHLKEKQAEKCCTVTLEDSKIDPWGVKVNFNNEWKEWKIVKVTPEKQGYALGIKKHWKIICVNDEEINEENWQKIKIILQEGGKMKIKFATKAIKSIWLIRHGEKDQTKIQEYMEIFKGRNYEWELSETGVAQSRRIGTVLKKQYENFRNPPLIFVSPFKRTIQTGLYAAYYLNSALKIEDGLLEKHHGLWDRTNMFHFFSNNLTLLDLDYQSKFPATKDRISPFRCEMNDAFDRSVANYFLEMLHKGNHDIIIIGHQTELHNIQSLISGKPHKETEKIECASMFQYVVNPGYSRLKLASYYLKGIKASDLL